MSGPNDKGKGTRGALALLLALGGGVALGAALYTLDARGLLPVKLPRQLPLLPGDAPVGTALPPMPPPTTPEPRASEARPAAEAAEPPPPSPPEGASPIACMRGMFPEDTFTTEPPIAFVCEQGDAIASVSQLKTQIVVAGRGRPATGGMKEWAVLGFYELASLAAMRGRCCPGAAALTVPDSPEMCGKLAEALAAIGSASAPGAPNEDLAAAITRFDEDVRCLAKLRQTQRFGYEPLVGSEASTFEKTAARLATKPPG